MVVGHQKQLNFLKRSAEIGRISHAYLFSGPSKIGKRLAAFEWLSFLFGERIGQNTVHPDLVFAAPDPETKNLKIETVRDLIKRLSLRPVISPIKAAVIDQAHLMTADSQNCLLKTLEEPGEKTLLILIADNPRLLLPTIVSRCETVKFGFVPKEEIKKYLLGGSLPGNPDKLDEEAMREIISLSFGRPGRAMDFISSPRELEKWRQEIGELKRVIAADLAERFKYVKKIAESEDLNEILEIWQFYFREMMISGLEGKLSAKAPERSSPPQKFEFTKTKTSPYTLERIRDVLQKIYRANFLITVTNANAKLVLENLMMEL